MKSRHRCGGIGLEKLNMVCEEKAEIAGKLSWIEAEPVGQDAPISVWWDQPPAGEDDDGYASLKAAVGSVTMRT